MSALTREELRAAITTAMQSQPDVQARAQLHH